MPEYRVEIAPSARAVCQDTVCKKEGTKIPKGDLRFGTWATYKEDQGSWKWKHWGCVSGLQMQQAHELCDRNEDGELAFDFLDGYDELEAHPDIQEKIRRCVTQSHIDPEDFKGDPDYNVPGQRGVRAPARKAKKAADNDSDEDVAGKTKPSAKRGKRSRKEADDSEAEDAKPAKKAKKPPKPKAGVKDEDSEDDSKPAKKAKKPAKRVKPESEDEEKVDVKPAKKARATKNMKTEPDTEDEKAPASSRTKKAAKKVKAEDDDEDVKPKKLSQKVKAESEDEDVKPAKPVRASRGKQAAGTTRKVKDESDQEDTKPANSVDVDDVKGENEDEKPTEKSVKKGRSNSTKAKLGKPPKSSPEDDVKDGNGAEDGNEEEEPAPVAKKEKKPRGSKVAKPAKAEASVGRRRSQRMSARA